MIFAHSISKRFGSVQAVRDVSFCLEPGQIAGLLGPNGAGKSTTIRMITGFLAPDQGRIEIGGHDTLRQPERSRGLIGYLPESCPVYPEMRAIDYLTYRARLYGLARRDARRVAAQAADRCRLGKMSTRRIAKLSKGYRQRVGLAGTLVHDPKVLVLDEPTNGLDPSQIREARSLIRELAENRTMLISSHILPEIERTCDRVLVIVAGRLCADGPPSQLMQSRGSTLIIEASVGSEHPVWRSLKERAPQSKFLERSIDEHVTRVELEDVSPEAATEIRRLLFESHIPLRELSTRGASLEDAFVRLAESAEATR